METKPVKKYQPLLFSFVIGAAILIEDAYTPVGVADGMLYVGTILPLLWYPGRRAIVAGVLLSSACIILGYFLSPGGSSSTAVAVANRFLSLVALWTAGAIICAYKLREESFFRTAEALREDLRKANNTLEERVRVRTKELIRANLALDREITERNLMEVEMSMLNSAIEQASETVLVTDADGLIMYVNPAGEHTTGYSKKELVGQNPRILKSGKQDPEFYKSMWNTIKSGKNWRGEVVNKRKSGELYYEYMNISPVFDQYGGITRFIAIKSDISGEKAMREQLVQAEKLSSIGTFVTGVAHELNNPLTAILGLSIDIAGNDGAPADLRGKLEVISRQSRRAAGIVQNLLKYSRKNPGEKAPADLTDIVNSVLALQEDSLRLANIAVEKEMAAEPLPVRAAVNQLQQVFVNIVLNAQHAMADAGRGTLTVRTFKKGAEALAVLENNGPPIPPSHLKNIFDPFFTTKEVGKGTGLGLNISYNIVQDHQGRIETENIGGPGVRFTVALPLSPPEEAAVPIIKTEPSYQGVRVLFVDDDEIIRFWIGSALLGQGVFVHLASDGQEAVKMLSEAEYDAIFSDLVMPHMNGYQLGQWLFENQPRLAARFVLVTGAITDGALEKYCKQYGFRFLIKPFEKEDILKVIGEIVRQQPGNPVNPNPAG